MLSKVDSAPVLEPGGAVFRHKFMRKDCVPRNAVMGLDCGGVLRCRLQVYVSQIVSSGLRIPRPPRLST